MEICQHIFSELQWIVCPTYLNFWLNITLLPSTELFWCRFPFHAFSFTHSPVEVVASSLFRWREMHPAIFGMDVWWRTGSQICSVLLGVLSRKLTFSLLRIGLLVYLVLCDVFMWHVTLLWRIHKWFLLNVNLKRKSRASMDCREEFGKMTNFFWDFGQPWVRTKTALLTVEKCHSNSE